jgi:hypothetical protein
MWIQSGREGVAHRLARAAEGEGGESAGVDGLQWFGAAVSTGAASTGAADRDVGRERRAGGAAGGGWAAQGLERDTSR